MPPIEINGQTVSNVVVNGQSVDEITANGQTVFTAIPDSEVSRDPDEDSLSDSGTRRGIVINPNTNLVQIDATISGNTDGLTQVGVSDSSNNVLASVTGSFTAGDTVVLVASLSAGSDYAVWANAEGNSYTLGFDNVASFPYTSTDVDIVGGTQGDGSGGWQTANDPSNILTIGAHTA